MSLPTPPPLRILISGAGIAGPCLAHCLTLLPSPILPHITILERSPTPRPTGQSIDIRGAAITVMKKLGLEEAARARDTTELGTRILNRKGGVVAEIPKGGKGGFTAEYENLRGELCGLFLDATKGREGVEYRYGSYVMGLEQDEKSVDVTFNDGTTSTFDLVVAADGASSRIRSMILPPSTVGTAYNFLGQYTAFFSIPSLPTDTRHWYWFNEPGGLCLMTRPHRTGKTVGVYMVICSKGHGVTVPDIEASLSEGVQSQKRVLKTYFRKSGWEAKRILGQLDKSADFYMARACQVKLPVWHSNRTVLVGDAAFATQGVGTSLAIESAYHLAGALSKMKSSAEVPAALNAYESVFRPIYKKSEDLPPGFPQIAFPQTEWGLRVRDAVAWMVGKTKVYKLLPDEEVADLVEYEWREGR